MHGKMRLALLGAPGTQGGGGIGEITLPQYLLQDAGTVLDGFGDVTDWTITKGSAENNTTEGEYRTGTQSIKVTSPADSDAQLDRAISIDFGGNAPHARLSFYWHGTATPGNVLVMFLGGGRYFYQQTQAGIIIRPGWNTFDFVPHAWSVSGGLTGTFTSLRVIVRPASGSGIPMVVSLDELRIGLVSTPAVIFMTDDGNASDYSVIHDYLTPKGGRATFYIVTNNIGGPTNMTAGQLQELNSLGYDLANHTHTHLHLNTLSKDDAVTQLLSAKGILDGLGLTRASAHVAYPYGSYNHTTVMEAMAEAGMLTGRVTGNRYNYWSCNTPDGDEDYLLTNYMALSAGTTLQAAQNWVDVAVSDSIPICFMTHDIRDVPVGDEWHIDRFRALVDYIVSKHIPFITVSDWYAAKAGPITVPFAG